MAAQDKFLQFPLCALALPGEPKDILGTIISYGLCEAGLAILRTRDAEELKRLCAEYGLPRSQYDGWALRAAVGAKLCGIMPGSLDACVERHAKLAAHVREREKAYGTDALVRMRKDVCFEVRDGGGMSFREFRILCAIYSLLGKHLYRAIRFKMIGARACGCKSEAVMDSELHAGWPLPAPFTIKQLRLTVAKLHELGWFARVTPDPHGRVTYYSNRMSGGELRERIFTRRTHSVSFHAEQQRKDAELMERIRQAKGTSFKTTPHDFLHPAVAPQGPGNGSAKAPAGH